MRTHFTKKQHFLALPKATSTFHFNDFSARPKAQCFNNNM